MGVQELQRLETGVRQLGFVLTAQQLQKFLRYREELISWNRVVNLTAITDPAEIEQSHFLDSLTVALALPALICSGGRFCDVGSGAGFPGIPLKILFPAINLVLIDSTAKRTRFLSSLVATLDMDNVEVYTGRCEELGHSPSLRESFDAVVSRAVAPLRVLAEYTLPFCRVGGRAVLQKKGDIQKELAAAADAWDKVGGKLLEVKSVPSDILAGERVLVTVEKAAPTPERYPRRPGLPAKRPL